ncbi:sulfatase-like hydrolase/transferase, partial [Bacteroidota bacterium]
MTRSLNLFIILIVIPFTLSAGLDVVKKDSPNFLILIADDAGMDFGCYGNSAIKTPNIDRLTKDGLMFESAFLTSPQCSPSRISILTGKYPHTTRTEDLHTPLPDGERFVTSYLQKAGYFTGHTNKTHYGPNGNAQFNWYSKDLADFSKFVKEARNKPFFFWTGFVDPHRGYQSGTIAEPHNSENVVVRRHLVDDSGTRKDIAMYYDEIARMDSVVGSYIEILQDEKKLKNTYVIFM